MNNRWDCAWKVFCDPSLPWGAWFISRLTKGEYEGYDVQVSEMTDLSTEQQRADGITYADKFLQLIVDNEKRVLHLEFQSTYAPNMCWRCLDYGLQQARASGKCTEVTETYTLPDSLIVSVRPTKFSQLPSRILRLKKGSHEVSLTYPIVDAATVIPEFKPLVTEKDMEQVRRAIVELGDVCGGFSNPSYSDVFMRACILASNVASYQVGGMDEYLLDSEVELVNEEKMTWSERIRNKTLEEAAHKLAGDFNIPLSKAYESLGLDYNKLHLKKVSEQT